MTTEADRPERGEQATVLASLPNGMFRLRMSDDREVVAHAAQDLRMALARLLPGDLVEVEVSPFDPNKARIRRLSKSQQKPRQPNPPHQPNKREPS
jgi:translation initiation factor IF-1